MATCPRCRGFLYVDDGSPDGERYWRRLSRWRRIAARLRQRAAALAPIIPLAAWADVGRGGTQIFADLELLLKHKRSLLGIKNNGSAVTTD